MEKDKITVLLVETMKKPRAIETGTNLKDMQDIVSGDIEQIMPYEDEVALVMNGEGKYMGFPYNRAVRNDEGKIIDVIAGDFFIAYAPMESESFESMPPGLMEKYADKFKYPERFINTQKGILAVPVKPERDSHER